MDKKLLIAKPIEGELKKFTTYYRDSIHSGNKHIQEVIDYTIKSDGKRIRPILLFLSAKACGEINEITYNSAVTIELLHTASLIHDDVVDESTLRRGRPSVNAVYDNKVAVLVGDFFLSTALIKTVLTGNIDLISNISNLGRNLSEGELNQLYIAKETIFNEEDYYEVIRKKTASLLSVSMKMGALSVGAPKEIVARFATLGEYLGICFQLRDDIFDYFGDDVGKPTGNDIREGKVTLPLIYALNNTSVELREHYISYLTKHELDESIIAELIEFAKINGGVDYTYQSMKGYSQKAYDLIMQMEDSESREALLAAIDYIIEREY
ncbi:MAG: polyprenyl synthetase [Bacteroidetes bacterium]|jgi:octaprenyl-diphosphate synthase|nr:polyprenyl synthetase [Bacteroidota bacterium]